MKIYLAARYSQYKYLQKIAHILSLKGHDITSRWIMGGHEISKEGSTEAHFLERRKFAEDDLHDLQNSDCCISFTEEPRSSLSRGGRHVEFGIALALGKRNIVIGPAENVFHCLPQVEIFDSIESLLSVL